MPARGSSFMDVFNRLAKEYDAWYDSEKGRPLYESEVLCLRPLVSELKPPLLYHDPNQKGPRVPWRDGEEK